MRKCITCLICPVSCCIFFMQTSIWWWLNKRQNQDMMMKPPESLFKVHYINSTPFRSCLFDLILYIPVNITAVMSGCVFLGWTSTKQRIKCLDQQYKEVSLVKLEPTTIPFSTPTETCSDLPISYWNLHQSHTGGSFQCLTVATFTRSYYRTFKKWNYKV